MGAANDSRACTNARVEFDWRKNTPPRSLGRVGKNCFRLIRSSQEYVASMGA